ncbi:MAG TPA: hypothetical protein PLT93_01915 [Phycisphaerae bacterium]|nr:hypothetical protein [Phycisphaerae bacterium]
MAMDPRDVHDVQGRPVTGANVYETEEKEKTAEVIFGGSTAEAVVGAAAVVLAILGLANMWPGYMASIATIAVGAALLFEGGAIASRYSDLARRTGASEIGGGVSAEILGGAAGIALGVLALLGIMPSALTPIAIIVFGGALLIGSAATARLNALSTVKMSDRARDVTRGAIEMASGTEVLIGIAAIVLGILALLGMAPRTLVLIGLLALGATVLFSGAAISSRMAGVFRR